MYSLVHDLAREFYQTHIDQDLLVQDWTQDVLDSYLGNCSSISIKLILKQWIKQDKQFNNQGQRKCQSVANDKITYGNKFFSTKSHNNDELLKIYTEAMAYAPDGSIELAKAYGNRSAVLCVSHMYEDSLKDIDRALKLNYPDELKAKLYARKAKNLLALGRSRREADEALAEVYKWLGLMNNSNRLYIENRLKEMKYQRSFAVPYNNCTNNINLLPDIHDPNKTLLGASSALEMKYSEKYGRHFVATRDIKPGELIIKENAYASVLSRHCYYSHCWYCSKRAWSSIPCKTCVNVVFCDESCRDKAWESFHDEECQLITTLTSEIALLLPDKKLSFFDIMTIRMTITAVKEAGTIDALIDKIQYVDTISDPLTKGFTNKKLDGSKYVSIYALTSDISCRSNDRLHMIKLMSCTLILYKWAKLTNVFGKKIENFYDLLHNKSAMFIGSLLVRNMDICGLNAFEATDNSRKEVFSDRGTMLNPLISYMNHSCDSNASLIHAGNIMGVVCVQNIKKGEQIFISYGQFYMVMATRNRRKILKGRYNFWCECRACMEDWGPCTTWSSFMNQQLPHEVKNKLRNTLEKFNRPFQGRSDQMRKITLKSDPGYIKSLANLVELLCDNANYPCDEIFEHKIALCHNYISNSY